MRTTRKPTTSFDFAQYKSFLSGKRNCLSLMLIPTPATRKKWLYHIKTRLQHLGKRIKRQLLVRFQIKNFAETAIETTHIPWHCDFRKLGYGQVIYDFGCGNGIFTIAYAQNKPTTLVIGCELAKKYFQHAVKKARHAKQHNAKFIHSNGITFLRDLIANHSLAEICINFPDPWHKNRHHKRRSFTPDFFKLCKKKLLPGGRISFISDNEEIFSFAIDNARIVFEQQGNALVEETPVPNWYPRSKYYRKWEHQGRTIRFFQVIAQS